MTAELPPPTNITDVCKQNTIIKTDNQATPSPTLSIHQTNGVIRLQQAKKDLDKYLAGSLLNPRPSTLLRAIRFNNLLTFLGLTINLIAKNFPVSEASLKGHLAQEQKNLRSTKPLSSEEHDEDLQPK